MYTIIVIIIIIIKNEFDLVGTVALVLQDHRTMSHAIGLFDFRREWGKK